MDPKLIEIILSDEKLANSKNFPAETYHDRPILRTAASLLPQDGHAVAASDRRRPAVYTGADDAEAARTTAGAHAAEAARTTAGAERLFAMKQLARSTPYQSNELIFYRQAKFMAYFEDDFDRDVPFSCYYPTYSMMTDSQLRTYFTWRTQLRNGTVCQTSRAYVLVYIYELLHLVGVRSPEEGYRALRHIWDAYCPMDPGLHAYLQTWLVDFLLYYGMDLALADDLPVMQRDRAVQNVLDGRTDTPDFFNSLLLLADYRLPQTPECPTYPEAVRQVLCRVYERLDRYYATKTHRLADYFVGQAVETSYRLFAYAVFYDCRRDRPAAQFPCNAVRCYRRSGQSWYVTCYPGGARENGRLHALIRVIDAQLRPAYGLPPVEDEVHMTALWRNAVARETEAFLNAKKEADARRVEIDLTRLPSIRASADVTRERLLTEEERGEATVAPVTEPAARGEPEPMQPRPGPAHEPEQESEQGPGPEQEPAHEPGMAAVAALEPHERRLLTLLLTGQSCAPLQAAGVLLSVTADRVNEKLFDCFGDTVITFTEDLPQVVEDYTDELKGWLGL